MQSEVIVVKKFIDIINNNVKTTLSGYHNSMLLLSFLNELKLDPTSTGRLGEEMHMSKKQKLEANPNEDIQQQIATKNLVRKIHLNII